MSRFLKAIEDGRVEKVVQYVNKQNINRRASDGITPLMRATILNHFEIVRILIEHGADVNMADDFSNTALMFCVRHGDVKTTLALMSAGADPRIKSSRGMNSIQYAYKLGRKNLLEIISIPISDDEVAAELLKARRVELNKSPNFLKGVSDDHALAVETSRKEGVVNSGNRSRNRAKSKEEASDLIASTPVSHNAHVGGEYNHWSDEVKKEEDRSIVIFILGFFLVGFLLISARDYLSPKRYHDDYLGPDPERDNPAFDGR